MIAGDFDTPDKIGALNHLAEDAVKPVVSIQKAAIGLMRKRIELSEI